MCKNRNIFVLASDLLINMSLSIGQSEAENLRFFLALKLSDVVFILIINVRMPTLLAFNISEQDKIPCSIQLSRPQGYKTFSMLNSAEHEIIPAQK